MGKLDFVSTTGSELSIHLNDGTATILGKKFFETNLSEDEQEKVKSDLVVGSYVSLLGQIRPGQDAYISM